MERAETMPATGVRDADLIELVSSPGPWATVELTTGEAIENGAQFTLEHWRALRRELEDHGAPDEVCEAIEGAVAEAHKVGPGVVVIASEAGVALVEPLPEAPARDRARWAPLPSLTRVIATRQAEPAHVIVLADRAGADVFGGSRHVPEIETTAGDVDHPLHKVPGGGWSHRRYQERVEQAWQRNAEAAAEAVARVAGTVDADIVIAAGDPRARSLLKEALPAELAAKVREVDGGRNADGSEDQVAEEVERLFATVVADATVTVLRRFKEEVGQRDKAVDGPVRTLEALRKTQVDVLLVGDDPDDDRTAWFGPDAPHVGLERMELASLGADDAEQAPLVDVAIRSALLGGASVRVVPPAGGPTDGLGGLLRWA